MLKVRKYVLKTEIGRCGKKHIGKSKSDQELSRRIMQSISGSTII
jgi:hypothetical protein